MNNSFSKNFFIKWVLFFVLQLLSFSILFFLMYVAFQENISKKILLLFLFIPYISYWIFFKVAKIRNTALLINRPPTKEFLYFLLLALGGLFFLSEGFFYIYYYLFFAIFCLILSAQLFLSKYHIKLLNNFFVSSVLIPKYKFLYIFWLIISSSLILGFSIFMIGLGMGLGNFRFYSDYGLTMSLVSISLWIPLYLFTISLKGTSFLFYLFRPLLYSVTTLVIIFISLYGANHVRFHIMDNYICELDVENFSIPLDKAENYSLNFDLSNYSSGVDRQRLRCGILGEPLSFQLSYKNKTIISCNGEFNFYHYEDYQQDLIDDIFYHNVSDGLLLKYSFFENYSSVDHSKGSYECSLTSNDLYLISEDSYYKFGQLHSPHLIEKVFYNKDDSISFHYIQGSINNCHLIQDCENDILKLNYIMSDNGLYTKKGLGINSIVHIDFNGCSNFNLEYDKEVISYCENFILDK